MIENWAPIDELPVLPRDNAWAREHGLADKAVFLYSGHARLQARPEPAARARTLGEPTAMRSCSWCPKGPGADWLAEHAWPDDALRLLPYQPYERLPEVLASADVLVAVLEPEAGTFSVPSKVLTYLCAGRPLLVSCPRTTSRRASSNGAAAGSSCRRVTLDALVAAAEELSADPGRRAELGRSRPRVRGERPSTSMRITDRFEEVLVRVRR